MRPARLTLSTLVVLLAVLGGDGRALGSAQEATPAGDARLDLAALTLRPGDLGRAGWLHEGAFLQDLPALARGQAAYLGDGTTADEVAATLAAAGWGRQYVAVAGRFSGGAADPEARVRSYVTEYASPEGAAAGFAFLEDESTVAGAADVPTDRTYGEASELTEERGTSAVDGRAFRSLDLTFRAGALVAGVTVIAYAPADLATPSPATPAPGSPERTAPDRATVERLAALLEGRVAGGGGGPGLGLGARVLRVAPDGKPDGPEVVTLDDAYYRLASDDVPLAGEAKRAAGLRTASYAGAVDVYQLWQGVATGTDTGVLFGATLLRFPDAAAEDWVGGLESTLAENPFYGDLRFEAGSGALELGDQAVALSYVAGSGGGDAPRAVLVAVRVGADVARVHLVPQGGLPDVPLEAAVALARAQAACLGAATCGGTIEVPAEVADLTAAAVAPAASPVASPATD